MLASVFVRRQCLKHLIVFLTLVTFKILQNTTCFGLNRVGLHVNCPALLSSFNRKMERTETGRFEASRKASL
jgi:hypothetical protein